MSLSAARIFGGIVNLDAKNIDNLEEFKMFKPFNRYVPFKPPPSSSPASRGRNRGRGLNDLYGLNF